MAAQFMSLALVAHTLGTSRYASYLAVTASVAWASLLGLGFLPALTARIARAVARGCRDDEIAMVSAGIWIAASAGGVLVILAAALSFLGTDAWFDGIRASHDPGEVRAGLLTALGVIAVHFLSSASTAIRAGYQESHISNGLSTIANATVLIGAWTVAVQGPDIPSFVLAIYAPFTLLFLYDLLRIFHARPYLWPPASPMTLLQPLEGRESLLSMCRVTWALQLYNFLINSGMVVLVSHLERSRETAEFGSLMRFVTLATSVISLLVTPLLPAISDAAARAEMSWVKQHYRRAVSLTLGAATIIGLVLAAAGPMLFRLWLGGANAPPQSVCIIFGLYFIVSMSSLTHFNFALALGGIQRVGTLFLMQAGLAYALALSFAPQLGNVGVGLAMLASTLAVTGWMLPRRVRERLAH